MKFVPCEKKIEQHEKKLEQSTRRLDDIVGQHELQEDERRSSAIHLSEQVRVVGGG